MFKLSFLTVLALTMSFLTLKAEGDPLRANFTSETSYLKVEVVNNGLIHFEAGAGAPPARQTPIPTSPQVNSPSFSPSSATLVRQNAIRTSNVLIEVTPETLCVTVTDLKQNQRLTVICPTMNTPDAELSMSQEQMVAVYGLGEKFRKPGQPNGDWLGDERLSGVADGNMMTGFDGNYTADMEIPVMYALGPHHLNYALFVDHVRAQQWNFKQDPWTMKTPGEVLRFYLFTGDGLPELRQNFVSLVGHSPIPPKKAFGLWVSQYGFKKWSEVEDRISILRAKKFPVDGFVMDLDWFGGISERSPDTHMGKLTWNRTIFNDPEQHIARYRDNDGVGLILIEEPYVGKNLGEFTTLKNKNALALSSESGEPAIYSSWFGQGGMIDWTNDAGAAYWHDTKRQPLVDMGVFGHWTDLGEPSELPSGMKYHGVDGIDGDDASHMHNLFNFKWHQSIAEGYQRNHVRRRPFMISRTGTTGMQRYGGALWSGDIAGRITSLAAHLNAQMNISFSGFDYFGADIGGFYRVVHDGELHQTYTRWFAHGAAFDVPVRPHMCVFSPADKTSPAEVGWTPSNLSNLRQRYELIPYYYSLAYRAYKYGEPLFPPPIYYFQDDPNLRQLGAEKLIGRDMLVVTEASQAFTTDVYLPQGEWTDFLTNEKYHVSSRGMTLKQFPLVRQNLFKLPTFVRAGAILPKALVDDKTMNSLGQRTDATHDEALRLQVFPGADASSFTVYEDDGETVDYKAGMNAVTLVRQQKMRSQLTIDIEAAEGQYVPQPLRQNIIEVMLSTNEKVHGVKLNGKSLANITGAMFEKDSGYSIMNDKRLLIKSGAQPIAQAKHFIIN